MAINRNRTYHCPVEVSLETIGGKWSALVLWHLLDGTRRFGQLRRLIPNVTEKMLTQTLRGLESNGLVSRVVYREVPPRVEYSLTEYGRGLENVLESLCKWGAQHAKKYGIPIEGVERKAAAKPFASTHD